ncbi:MAG: hypothetical protein IJC34_00120 [Lentisphaeria bacterium]|nr:hypothetical protein [Lentisphaeria bacterium]
MAGRVHGAKHRVRAREYGLVRTCTDLYGRWAQGYVGAVRSGNSKAQGAEVWQNIPVHSLAHGARPFGAERAGA